MGLLLNQLRGDTKIDPIWFSAFHRMLVDYLICLGTDNVSRGAFPNMAKWSAAPILFWPGPLLSKIHWVSGFYKWNLRRQHVLTNREQCRAVSMNTTLPIKRYKSTFCKRQMQWKQKLWWWGRLKHLMWLGTCFSHICCITFILCLFSHIIVLPNKVINRCSSLAMNIVVKLLHKKENTFPSFFDCNGLTN